MGIKVWCSAQEQVMPYFKAEAVQYSLTMRIMAVKTALVSMILLFLALSFVCEGLIIKSTGATDGAEPLLDQEVKVAPVRLRNRVYTVLLNSRSRFAGAIQAEINDGEEITEASSLKASKRQHLRKMLARRLQDVSDGNCNAVAVATRFRSAQFRRRMGPAKDPARQRIPLTSRPVKALFILCAKKKVGVRVAMTSPSRAAPAIQHVIPYGNNHRRALKQLPSLRVPPLPFTRPPAPPRFQFPPLPFTRPPAPPRFQFPPLPFTPAPPRLRYPPLSFSPPALPQLQVPSLPNTLPQVPTLLFTLPVPPPKSLSLTLPPLPPFPFINIPPLPFQLPPIPCVPSSSGKSLPPP